MFVGLNHCRFGHLFMGFGGNNENTDYYQLYSFNCAWCVNDKTTLKSMWPIRLIKNIFQGSKSVCLNVFFVILSFVKSVTGVIKSSLTMTK